MSFSIVRPAHLINNQKPQLLDHLGPSVEVLTSTTDVDDSVPGLMRGTISAGGFVPMHSHADPETFYVLSGQLEGLSYVDSHHHTWVPLRVGDIFHVYPHSKHALRNTTGEPAETLIISTHQMAEFFERNGVPIPDPDAPRPAATPARVQTMLESALQAGHWLATPEENEKVGLHLRN